MHDSIAAADGGIAGEIVETGGGLHPERVVPPGKRSMTWTSAWFAEPVSVPRGGSNASDSDSDVSTQEKGSSSSSSWYAQGVLLNASTRIKQVSQELRRLASFRPSRIDKSKSAARHAIDGLRFIARYYSHGADWHNVEKRFEQLAENGLLHRSKFGKCIRTNELALAGELFDALARRRNISGDSISKAELFEFLDQISDCSFDGRLQNFLDM